MLCELLLLIFFIFLFTDLTKAGVVESGKGLIIAGFEKTVGRHLVVYTLGTYN
jgi:hypothetical protein